MSKFRDTIAAVLTALLFLFGLVSLASAEETAEPSIIVGDDVEQVSSEAVTTVELPGWLAASEQLEELLKARDAILEQTPVCDGRFEVESAAVAIIGDAEATSEMLVAANAAVVASRSACDAVADAEQQIAGANVLFSASVEDIVLDRVKAEVSGLDLAAESEIADLETQILSQMAEILERLETLEIELETAREGASIGRAVCNDGRAEADPTICDPLLD